MTSQPVQAEAAAFASRSGAELELAGDRALEDGRVDLAIGAYLEAASGTEIPPSALCLKLARGFTQQGARKEALQWAAAVVDGGDDFSAWLEASALAARSLDAPPATLRRARVALTGSYTLTQFAAMLRLAALRAGIAVDLHEGGYGQYRQDVLDPGSALYQHAPDFVVLAVHEGEVALPRRSASPSEDVQAELGRWTMLWGAVERHSKARVVQHNFVLPPHPPLGHLSTRVAGSRYAMTQALNLRLGEAAGEFVAIVDCDRIAGMFGKRQWHDPRYWHHARQAVSLGALPLLARHTASVLAADVGLSRKCVVLDLDNTLWGGIIGEDGLTGIALGGDARGNAFVEFQEHLLDLKDRGVILAVCSKNDPADARAPFEHHPEMRIRLEDVSAFVAGWESKVDGLRRVARQLGIGLDALVFVDDSPAERQVVRQLLPDVHVVTLPPDPSGYARALSECLLLEPGAITAEDVGRAEQYRGRAAAAALEQESPSLDAFYRSLDMRADVRPFRPVDHLRLVQLIGKTNQFNLTTRRHSAATIREFAADPACVHLSLSLRDRFTDHGLVAVMIAIARDSELEIDTWLMSCRVIGRTVDTEMLAVASRAAIRRGLTTLRGTYVPTAKNALVADVFRRHGFELVSDDEGETTWRYDLAARGAIENGFIATVEHLDTDA